MTAVHRSETFGDLLDPRFETIFFEQYDQVPDMIPQIYTMPPDNGRENMTFSGIGAFGDFQEFKGTVEYDSVAQAFDSTLTHIEFASGYQVERKLYDDDQYQIFDGRPKGLGRAAQRTRQKHAARIFNNGFTVDTYFYENSEGKPLFSDSHLTNSPEADTSTGFDNKMTSAFSATALAAARIQMVNFRDDRGNHINCVPDTVVYPINLYDKVYEVLASTGKPDSANNDRNVHEGAYGALEWIYLSDSNNWFLCDSSMKSESLFWVDRVPLEHAMAEDIDTIVAKWRAYMRYSCGWADWRWTLGSQVS